MHKANSGCVKIRILRRSLTDTILISEDIRQHQCTPSQWHLIAVSKQHRSRFLPTKIRLDQSIIPRFKRGLMPRRLQAISRNLQQTRLNNIKTLLIRPFCTSMELNILPLNIPHLRLSKKSYTPRQKRWKLPAMPVSEIAPLPDGIPRDIFSSSLVDPSIGSLLSRKQSQRQPLRQNYSP